MKTDITLDRTVLAVALLAWCWLSYSATAQTEAATVRANDAGQADPAAAANPNLWTVSVSADYSAVAARDVSFNGASGRSGAQSATARVAASVPLDERWFVPIGLDSHNLFLGTFAGAPIPDQIDTLGLSTGLGYHLGDQWTFVGAVGPRFYRLDSLESDDVGIGALFRATYKWKPNLTVAFGLSVEPDRDVPVLPAAGLRWEIRDDLILSLMFPRTGLEYRVAPKLSLLVGLDGNFTVFRAENDLGNKIGQSQFNNGLGTYREFRVSAGVEYRFLHGLSAEVEGGFSFRRELDYTRIDQTVRFGSAPFVQAGLRWRL